MERLYCMHIWFFSDSFLTCLSHISLPSHSYLSISSPIPFSYSSFSHNLFEFLKVVWFAPFHICFNNVPKVFNRIKVRTVGGPVQNYWNIVLEKVLCSMRSMLRIIILLEVPSASQQFSYFCKVLL